MRALTDIGNTFAIRHFETTVTPIPTDAYDYLYARMGGMVGYLLRASNRGAS